MRGEQAARFFILAVFALTGYLLYLIYLPFLNGFAWGAFLAIAFYPVYTRIVRLLRGRQTLAAILTTLLVTALMVVPVTFVVSSLASTALRYVSDLESEIRQAGAEIAPATASEGTGGSGDRSGGDSAARERAGAVADGDRPPGGAGALEPGAPGGVTDRAPGDTGAGSSAGPGPGGKDDHSPAVAGAAGAAAPAAGTPPDRTPRGPVGSPTDGARGQAGGASSGGASRRFSSPFLDRLQQALAPYIDVTRIDLEGYAITAVQRLATLVASQGSAFVGNALGILTTFIITMIMMALLFLQGEGLIAFFRRSMPLTEADKEEVLKQLHEMTRAIFYGVMMTAAMQAVLGGIGWRIVGLPSPVVAGVAMFFCALLPVGGTPFVWVPGSLWLFYQGHTFKGIFLVVWGIVVISLLDNFVRPIFISGRTKVPMIPILLSILGGITAFGMTGLFIGPLVMTLFLVLLDVIRRDFFPPEAPPPPAPS